MCRSKSEGGRRCTGRSLRGIAHAPGATTRPLYGGMSMRTELVTTPDGRAVVRKSPHPYDPDPGFLADGEVLASRLAAAVGAPIAHVERDGDCVLVEYVPGEPCTGVAPDTADVHRIGLVDALTGYADRATGLLTSPDGRITAIDSGGSWLDAELGRHDPHLREPEAPARHWVDRDGDTHQWRTQLPIPPAELAALAPRVEALRPQFAAAGREAWLDWSLDRLDALVTHAEGSAR